jgi:excisionase family DNA binding protein
MESELFNVENLTEMFNCSKTAIYKLIRDKKIKFKKLGMEYKFTHQAVEEYLSVSDVVKYRPTILVPQRKRGRKAS